MARLLRDHPGSARIAAPAVRAKMLATLGRKLQPSDAQDVMQEAYLRLFRLIDRLPPTEDGLLGLTYVIVQGERVRLHRKTAVHDARHVEVEAVADHVEDSSALSPQDHRENQALYEYTLSLLAAGEVDADCVRWAARLARGDDYATIAADEGLPEATVRKRMERFRKFMRQRWVQYSGIGVGSVVVLFALLLFRPEPQPAAVRPEPVPRELETPRDTAARLLSEARTACDRGDWTACRAKLDEAKAVYPPIETTTDMKQMRDVLKRVAPTGSQ